jgi:two-component system, chemotaxis family, CheB/CheR fusion protein
VLANDRARVLFAINANDIGRAFHDLEVSYRPAELRSLIEQAIDERRSVSMKDIEWTMTPGETSFLEVQVTPLVGRRSISWVRR